MKQKNGLFEIGDLVGDFTKSLVTRIDGAPYCERFCIKTLHTKFVMYQSACLSMRMTNKAKQNKQTKKEEENVVRQIATSNL